MPLTPFVCFRSFGWVWVTEWPPIGKIAAHSAYYVFSLFFIGFLRGNLFLVFNFFCAVGALCMFSYFYLS